MAKADYIVSDLHLGAVPDATEHAFVRFLDHVRGDAASLLVAGDLFDFWFEYGDVIPGRHFRTLAALARFVEAGVPVFMAGGNHDAWGGRFLRERVGLHYHTEPFRMEIGGRSALIAHGDGLGSGDLKYRMLKAVIRSRAAVGAFRALHPELGMKLARAVSSTEGKQHDQPNPARVAFLERWAAERLAEDPSLGFVVCGHAHAPIVREVSAGRYYLNSGDWLDQQTYITVSPEGEPGLHHWTG